MFGIRRSIVLLRSSLAVIVLLQLTRRHVPLHACVAIVLRILKVQYIILRSLISRPGATAALVLHQVCHLAQLILDEFVIGLLGVGANQIDLFLFLRVQPCVAGVRMRLRRDDLLAGGHILV